MKKIIFVFLLAVLVPSVYAWEPNFYFTVPPNGEKCFDFNIPKDFNTGSEDRYQINITSDLPVNLNFIETYASTKNNIDLPICFSAKNRNESEFGYYKIFLKSKSKERILKGGICISSLDDVDVVNKQAEPCDLINSHNNLFSASLSPSQVITSPEKQTKISLRLLSSEDIDIEIRPETNINLIDKTPRIVRLERGRVKTEVFDFVAPKKGEYNFSVDLAAIVNREYCNFPFCKLRLDTTVSVDGVKKTGWDMSVFPISHSVNRLEPTEFLVTIDNHEDDKDFIIDAIVPQGLRTDFRQTTINVKKDEQKDVLVRVVPENLDQKLYTLAFTAQADRQEVEQAYLSVGEIITDTCRKFPILCQGGKIPNLGGCTLKGTSLINTSCLINQQTGGPTPGFNLTNGQGNQPTPEPTGGINPLLVVIPILIIILAFVYLFYRKKSESVIEVE